MNTRPTRQIGLESMALALSLAGLLGWAGVRADTTPATAPAADASEGRATLIVRQKTAPQGAPGRFRFDLDGQLDDESFGLSAGGIQQFNFVSAGTVGVTQQDAGSDGFVLRDVFCTVIGIDSKASPDLRSGSIRITLAPGEKVDCTFTNRRAKPHRLQPVLSGEEARYLADRKTTPAQSNSPSVARIMSRTPQAKPAGS